MTKEFIKKRIKEQEDYIKQLDENTSICLLRTSLLRESAEGQLNYFTQKLKQMNKSPLEKVTDFMLLFDQRIGLIDELEPLPNRQLRIKLLFEELQELAEAGDVMGTFTDLCDNVVSNQFNDDGKGPVDGDNVNKKEQLDAYVDNLYILLGGVNSSGLHEVFDEGFNLIHDNNMNKAHRNKGHAMETAFRNNWVESKYNIIEKEGIFLLYNVDGKLTKPFDHKKVDLSKLL
jgi:predicted HAD superfamily Cof-like phosphohydrolase